MKIAAISDIHFGAPGRQAWCYEEAPALLERAVEVINTELRPDVTVILGDLLQDPEADDASERMQRLFEVFAQLDGPWCAIRGNHDWPPDEFHRIFPEAADPMDVGTGRIVAFGRDPDEPDFMSSRTPEQIGRFAAARKNYTGPLVAIQHVPVVPPEAELATFNYVNATELLTAMQDSEVSLSLSGHYHDGFPIHQHGTTWLCATPPFCEAPHVFMDLCFEDLRRPQLTPVAIG